MDTVQKIRDKARRSAKTIALPEYDDPRVIEAHKIVQQEGLAKTVLVTPEMVDPAKKEQFIQEFYEMRKGKGVELESVRKLFDDTLYYAAMMTRHGEVDGFVAGAAHTTADMARAAIHSLGMDERFGIACSCFIMCVPDCQYGQDGSFIFADCGVIPDPNSRQLACIAAAASELGLKILDLPPRVAFLSYSTKGSAKSRSSEKIYEAIKIAREIAPEILVDGDLQGDAAIVPEVAKIKVPEGSPVAGRANVLVFPSLDAGNICYKLVERLAKARAVGPIMMGLTRPCSDLSRGCSARDVADCVAVTAVRAQ